MAATPDLQSIEDTATTLRRAIERYAKHHPRSWWGAFPHGDRCYPTSILLARCLQEAGLSQVEIVTADLPRKDQGSGESHTWCEVGGVVIDITADQFGALPPVVVAAGGTSFHRSLLVKRREPPHPASSLADLYDELKTLARP